MDRYAVAVVKDEMVVSDLIFADAYRPRKPRKLTPRQYHHYSMPCQQLMINHINFAHPDCVMFYELYSFVTWACDCKNLQNTVALFQNSHGASSLSITV